jgi:hypothetical protein
MHMQTRAFQVAVQAIMAFDGETLETTTVLEVCQTVTA